MQAEITRRAHGTGTLRTRRQTANGREVWIAKWRDASGRQVNRTLGAVRAPHTAEGLTRPQAERALREAMVLTKPTEDRRVVTVDQVALALLDRMRTRGRASRTLAAFDSARRIHFGALAQRRVSDVTRSHVDAWVAGLVALRLKPKTVRNLRGDLHAVFALALREGWCDRNPVAGSECPAVPRSTGIMFLEPEQVAAIVRAVPDDAWGEVERDLYPTAAYTGLRQGELLELRGRDVDLAASILRAERKVLGGEVSETKGRAVRSVPLAPQVAQVLAARMLRHDVGPDDLIFASPTGGHFSRWTLGTRFDQAVAAAGVPRVTFHMLRHTFGTLAARAGVDVRTLQAWLGHTELATTQVYLHYAPQPGASALLGQAFARPDSNQLATNLR
jgi:integrase